GIWWLLIPFVKFSPVSLAGMVSFRWAPAVLLAGVFLIGRRAFSTVAPNPSLKHQLLFLLLLVIAALELQWVMIRPDTIMACLVTIAMALRMYKKLTPLRTLLIGLLLGLAVVISIRMWPIYALFGLVWMRQLWLDWRSKDLFLPLYCIAGSSVPLLALF